MSVNGAQTFTITASPDAGSQTITSVALEFVYAVTNTATFTHSADLSNLGGSSNFTGSSVTLTPAGGIAPNTSKTFTLDYTWTGGDVDNYQYATVLVTPTSAVGTGTQQQSTITLYTDSTAPFGFPEGGGGGEPPGGGEGPPTQPQ